MHALSVRSKFSLSVRLDGGEEEVASRSSVLVDGQPDARHFTPHLRISSTLASESEALPEVTETGSAVEVGERDIVLNPLHPVRRFPVLRADQHWRVTLIDPFAFGVLPRSLGHDKLRETFVGTFPTALVLEARVEPGQQILEWEDKKKVPCRIIRVGEDDPLGSMTVWVAAGEVDGNQPEVSVNGGSEALTLTPLGEGLVMKQEVRLNLDSWVMVRRSQPVRHSPVKTPRKKS
jgi:hypothetical protein